jgi:hypothetical protein
MIPTVFFTAVIIYLYFIFVVPRATRLSDYVLFVFAGIVVWLVLYAIFYCLIVRESINFILYYLDRNVIGYDLWFSRSTGSAKIFGTVLRRGVSIGEFRSLSCHQKIIENGLILRFPIGGWFAAPGAVYDVSGTEVTRRFARVKGNNNPFSLNAGIQLISVADAEIKCAGGKLPISVMVLPVEDLFHVLRDNRTRNNWRDELMENLKLLEALTGKEKQ